MTDKEREDQEQLEYIRKWTENKERKREQKRNRPFLEFLLKFRRKDTK